MPAYYDVHGGVLRHESGFSQDVSSDEAKLAFEDSERGRKFRRENPEKAVLYRRSKRHSMRSLPYRFGRFLGNATGLHNAEYSGVGRIMEEHPILGAGLGALLGAGLGGIASFGAGKLGFDISPTTATIGGAGLGGGLGWLLSYLRRTAVDPHVHDKKYDPLVDKAMSKSGSIIKRAAMYQDPRNFILEKLQSDYTLDFGAKASLAAKVRTLNQAEADKLAKLVRQAVGIGVGALIAKFVFGGSSFGTALGGLAGLGLYNAITSYRQANAPINAVAYNPYAYNSII